MWTLIYLIEDDGEQLPDLIPNTWKIDERTCWYPKALNSNIIKSLAKAQSMPDHNTDNWDCCVIKIVENNIVDYKMGIKMMYKLAKNATNLYSDNELRGRGLRLKRKSKISFSNIEDSPDDEEKYTQMNTNNTAKKQNVSYPAFPAKQKSSCENTLFDDKLSKLSEVTHKDDLLVPVSTSENYNDTNNSEEIKCKLSKKTHNCTFHGLDKYKNETLLISIAHQLCKMSAENKKIKSSMNYLKQELTSFIEDKPNHNRDQTSGGNSEENILSQFPLKTEEDLQCIEKKLESEDLAYTNKLVTSFLFASEGKTVTKVTNNLLRTIFTIDLASKYSWKGQKEKKQLNGLKIFKVIISTICKKFASDVNAKSEAIESIKTRFAQAPFRYKKQQKRALSPVMATNEDGISLQDE